MAPEAAVPERARDPAAPRVCPRCGAQVRYRACATCGYRFDAEPDAGDGVVARAEPATARLVAHLVGPSDASSLRVSGAGYAVALLGAGDAERARTLLRHLLETPGDRPGDADLLVLLAHAAELAGDPDAALDELLDATLADPERVLAAEGALSALLDRARSERVLRDVVRRWPRHLPLRDLPERARSCVSSLCLTAALRLGDEAAAATATTDLVELLGPSAAPAVAAVLRHVTAAADATATLHLLAARQYRAVGALDEALAAAERALELGLADDGGETSDAAAEELRGDLLGELGRASEAGAARLAAGRAFYWADEFPRARALLETAADQRPDDPMPRWYLADTMRILAMNSEPYDAALLERARAVWAAGWTAETARAAPSWAARVEGTISSCLADAVPEREQEETWKAVSAVEEAVAIDPADAVAWTALAGYYRRLALLVTAADAAEVAVGLDPGSTDALRERAWAAALLGDPAARAHADAYFASGTVDPFDGGLIESLLRGYEHARALLLDRAGDAVDVGVWYLLARAAARLGDDDEARRRYGEVWEHAGPSAPEDSRQVSLALADVGYRLGNLDAALRILEVVAEALPASLDWPFDVEATRTTILLAGGRVHEAGDACARALETAVAAADVDDLASDLDELAADHRFGRAQRAAARKLAKRVRATAVELRGAPRDRAAAVDELRRAAAVGDGPASARGVACLAGLARLLVDLGRFAEASEAATALLQREPASTAGVRRQLAAILALVDDLLRAGRYADARTRLAGSGVDLATAPEGLLGDLLARRALAEVGDGACEDAEATLAEAEAALARAARPADEVVRTWVGVIGDAAAYWRIRRGVADEAPRGGRVGRVLDGCLAGLVGLDRRGEATWPWAVPVRLGIAEDLVPDDTTPTGPMLGTYVPELRSHIAVSMGLESDDEAPWLPGVSIRPVLGLASGGFEIEIDEVVRRRARIPADRRFCRGAAEAVRAGVPAADPLPEVDPRTGAPACWIAPSATDDVEARGFEVWRDPLRYVVAVLERELRRNLDRFLNVDKVGALLAGWDVTAGGGALPDLVGLTALVRALAREQVPFADPARLVALAAPPLRLADAVRDYRLAVAADLPGQDLPARDVPALLDGAAEAALAGPPPAPQDVLAALAELREALAAEPQAVALVAGDAIRPVVKGLVAAEFPDLPVLSATERLAAPAGSRPGETAGGSVA